MTFSRLMNVPKTWPGSWATTTHWEAISYSTLAEPGVCRHQADPPRLASEGVREEGIAEIGDRGEALKGRVEIVFAPEEVCPGLAGWTHGSLLVTQQNEWRTRCEGARGITWSRAPR